MANTEKTKVRTISVDGDSIDVQFQYDEQFGVWLGEYPFFKEEPRYTPSCRPWRNAVYTECPYHGDPDYRDCGTCKHFKKADPGDMIGVCFNEKLRQQKADTV